MLQLKNLPKETIKKIDSISYDCILGRHEGPESWDSCLKYYDPEFMKIEGKSVLLPLSQKEHKNITILRTIIDKKEEVLTIFFKDASVNCTPDEEMFFAGFMAICEKMRNEEFYIATLYHEWFIIDKYLKKEFSGWDNS